MTTSPYIKKIQTVRKAKGLTQQDMADRLGYHDPKEYGRIETGDKRLTLELLESIANVFEMTMISLLSFDEKAFFNQCTGAMSVNGDNTYYEANKALTDELHERLKEQSGDIAFLRKQVEVLLGTK